MDNIDYHISKKKPVGFLRSISILVSGTAVAHGITALAMPVLSRLYSPADFSAFAVFSSLLAVISVAACLRFDIAVTLPDNDTDAVNILALALNSAVIVSLLLSIPSLLMTQKISFLLNQPNLELYLWLLPIGVLLAASYSAFQNWFVRKEQFGIIATSRVGQSVAAAGTQVGLGFTGVALLGLLIGYIMNSGAACIVLVYNFLKVENKLLNTISLPRMRAMAATHHRFPKYSTFEAFSNSAAIQVPIIIIAALAEGPEAGYLLLAMSVIQAPMALFGTAIGQVYLSRAPQEYRNSRLGSFTAEILGGLIKAGVGPLLAVGILSPIVFGPLFGEGWVRAGWLLTWMTPWFIMQFLASPISMALHVTGHQRTAFALQVFGLVFRVLSVWVAAQLPNGPVSEAYALSGALFYLIYLWLILRCVKSRSTEIRKMAISGIGITGAWMVASILIALFASIIMKQSMRGG